MKETRTKEMEDEEMVIYLFKTAAWSLIRLGTGIHVHLSAPYMPKFLNVWLLPVKL